MYVDESGDPGFPPSGLIAAQGGSSERYVRVGVIVHAWKWPQTDRTVAQFKQAHNLDWDDEIRASDIKRGKKAFKTWPPAQRNELMDNLLDTIGRELSHLSLIGVVIHKHLVDRERKERLSNPSPRSLELLLGEYNSFLQEQKDKCGIVVLDAGETKNDANLRYFQNYLRQFSERVDARRIIEGSFFLRSHESNLLQVADVCANTLLGRFSWAPVSIKRFARIEDRFRKVIEWPRPK